MSAVLPAREADAGLRSLQGSLPGLCPVSAAVESLSHAGGTEARGAIFTRREVVEFLLDLTGYVAQADLTQRRLLEPSFGQGDFLLPAIDRLLASWARRPHGNDPVAILGECIRAVELHRATFTVTRTAVIERLAAAGLSLEQATAITARWLINADFLLVDLPEGFDTVVGNPPYVRQELIPDVLLAEYRNRYHTIFDRADIYVPFIERSLRLLGPGGNLGFICADRWMKNRYGGPLRQFVSDAFHLRVYVDMSGADAFHSEVVAYPAITVIRRGSSGATRIASQPRIDADALQALSGQLLAPELPATGSVQQLDGVTAGSAPWILDASGHIAIVRRLEAALPALEEAGCRVGIGVATGADRAFIGPYDELDVEDDRKLPLAMTRDIDGGTVKWRGFGVINPFADGGGLVRLDDYPRLKQYLEARRELIAGRHVARKAPANWYRTIDRITPGIASTPKLLIPDIKGDAHIVYEKGELYPHHNLYYITSQQWDLHALQAVLLSSVTRMFIAAYSTKMRGGYLRFQAQYLRRLRLPEWHTVPHALRLALAEAAESRDIDACDQAAFRLYGLSPRDMAALRRRDA